jgi:hypothetical protein
MFDWPFGAWATRGHAARTSSRCLPNLMICLSSKCSSAFAPDCFEIIDLQVGNIFLRAPVPCKSAVLVRMHRSIQHFPHRVSTSASIIFHIFHGTRYGGYRRALRGGQVSRPLCTNSLQIYACPAPYLRLSKDTDSTRPDSTVLLRTSAVSAFSSWILSQFVGIHSQRARTIRYILNGGSTRLHACMPISMP